MTDLNAPKPGTELTIRATVLTADVQLNGKHYGDNVHLVLRIDDGIDGVAFANVYAAVDNKGRWFTRPAQDALRAIDEGRDPAEPKLKPKTEPKTKSKKAAYDKPSSNGDAPAEPKPTLDPANDDDLAGFTVRQLRALADRKKIAVPTSAKKAELVAIVRDALAEANAA